MHWLCLSSSRRSFLVEKRAALLCACSAGAESARPTCVGSLRASQRSYSLTKMARRKGADRWRSFCCGSFVSILLALMLLVTTNDETFSGLHHSLRTTFETFIGKTHAPGDSGLALAKADYHGFPHAADGAGGAGQAAVPAPLPHSETVPLPSTRPNAPPPRDRVLVVQNLREGLGAYPDGLIEMFKLARRLRRWIVEPCIRNGW